MGHRSGRRLLYRCRPIFREENMNVKNVKLETASVLIEAHKQALLQQPDPAIAKKPLLRVPLGEGLDIGRSAQEWTDCWRTGAIAMADDYYLAHGRSLSKADMNSLHSYVFINHLDPSVLQNW